MAYCDEMFQAADWYVQINFLSHLNNLLESFVLNKELRELYFQKTFKPEDKEFKDAEEWWLGHRLEEIRDFFDRQTIVLLNTYIELMLKEFFKCFFCLHHIHMYDYLQAGFNDGQTQKGFVSLKKIVEAKSKKALISKLADEATSNITSYRFSSILGNLEKLTKEKVPEDLRKGLLDIVEKRNQIVHEHSEEKLKKAFIEKAVNDCEKFVAFLVPIAKKNGIFVNLIEDGQPSADN